MTSVEACRLAERTAENSLVFKPIINTVTVSACTNLLLILPHSYEVIFFAISLILTQLQATGQGDWSI